jgi:hypothetical protein
MDLLRGILNPGWVSSLIGLMSLVAALLIYRASRIGVRPVFQRRSWRLIGQEDKLLPNEVEIRFGGRTVERRTKTHVVFWNSGKATLRGTDIVDLDPLRCDFSDDSEVLAVRVLKSSRATNQFTAMIDPERHNRILMKFDYLDPEDGAALEVLHTDTRRYPKVLGSIRGVPRGVVDWGRIAPVNSRELPFPFKRRRVVLVVATLIGLSMAFTGLFVPSEALQRFFGSSIPSDPARLRSIVAIVGGLYAALPLLLMWVTRRRFPKALVSEELDL